MYVILNCGKKTSGVLGRLYVYELSLFAELIKLTDEFIIQNNHIADSWLVYPPPAPSKNYKNSATLWRHFFNYSFGF